MSKTVRLTKHIKDRIRRRLIVHAFEEREKANAAGFHQLADAVYHDLYPEALLKQMNAMPGGFLPEDTDVSVCFEQVERFARLWYSNRRRVAQKHTSNAAKVYEENHEFSKWYAKLDAEKKKIKEERRGAEQSAMAVMDNVTTLKRLIEVWPEVEPFARDFLVSAQSGTLPALPIGDLNKRLGLEKQS